MASGITRGFGARGRGAEATKCVLLPPSPPDSRKSSHGSDANSLIFSKIYRYGCATVASLAET